MGLLLLLLGALDDVIKTVGRAIMRDREREREKNYGPDPRYAQVKGNIQEKERERERERRIRLLVTESTCCAAAYRLASINKYSLLISNCIS